MRRRDALLAAAVGVFIAVDVRDARHEWVLVLVLAVPLALRTLAPLACVAIVCIGCGAYVALYGDPDSVALLPPMLVAAYSAGAHRKRGHAYVAAGLLLAFSVSVALQKEGAPEEFFFVAVVLAVPWIAGLLARDYTRRAEQLTELAAELEREQVEHSRLLLSAERARIAAELSDAIAHSVSAMTMQANAAAAALERDPEAARGALREVQETGREAILELRRMLGLLRRAPG